MTKITYLQALIDSSMLAEVKTCNEAPKRVAGTRKFVCKFCKQICNIDRPVKSFKVNFKE